MRRFFPWFWALVGALVGVGFIAILSIGWGLIAAGIILAVIVAGVSRGRGAWAVLIGLGLAPAAILLFDLVTAPPPCPATTVIVTDGSYTCGNIPSSYMSMAIGFLVFALIGALIPLILRVTRAQRPGQKSPTRDAA